MKAPRISSGEADAVRECHARYFGAFARDAGRVQPVMVRVIPGVEGHTHAYVDTGGRHSKFGTPIAEGLALQAIKLAASLPSLEFRGIQAHVDRIAILGGNLAVDFARILAQSRGHLRRQQRRDQAVLVG